MKILTKPKGSADMVLKGRKLDNLEMVWNEGCLTYPKIKVTFSVWKDKKGPIVRIFLRGSVWWIF